MTAPRLDAKDKWLPVLYFVIGQAGWFACVLGAARGWPWSGTLTVLALVTVHLCNVARPIEELKLLLAVAAIGGTWDSALVSLGLTDYTSGVFAHGLAPHWIWALWALFAAQINRTYTWLKSRLALAVLMGAIAGPLSFRAGAALGALHFATPWLALAALSIGWAVLLPVAIVLSRRWNGCQMR